MGLAYSSRDIVHSHHGRQHGVIHGTGTVVKSYISIQRQQVERETQTDRETDKQRPKDRDRNWDRALHGCLKLQFPPPSDTFFPTKLKLLVSDNQALKYISLWLILLIQQYPFYFLTFFFLLQDLDFNNYIKKKWRVNSLILFLTSMKFIQCFLHLLWYLW